MEVGDTFGVGVVVGDEIEVENLRCNICNEDEFGPEDEIHVITDANNVILHVYCVKHTPEN